MGVTCSLLGHDYGAVQTDREREERGDEVIVTTREVQVCSRCGAELVKSENTEVRPVRSGPKDTESDTADDPSEEETWGGGTASGGSGPGTRSGPEVDVDAGIGPESSAEEPADAGDGVILDENAESEPSERGPGEWPDADDTRLGDDRQTPEVDQTGDEPATAADESDETEILDAEPDADSSSAEPEEEATEPEDDSGSDDTESPSEWPDPGPAGSEEGFDATTPSEAEPDDDLIEPEPGGAGAAVPSSDSPPAGDVLLVCDSCEFSEGAVGSSHRSGDICPECKRGYLEEQSQ